MSADKHKAKDRLLNGSIIWDSSGGQAREFSSWALKPRDFKRLLKRGKIKRVRVDRSTFNRHQNSVSRRRHNTFIWVE